MKGHTSTLSSGRVKMLATTAGIVIAVVLLGAAVCSAQTPPATDGWVVLPVDDYRALREAAFPREREPEPPPVEATLTRIDYEIKIESELATGEAKLTIDVIKNGWVRVAIPAGLMIRDAHLDGRPVSLATQSSDKSGDLSYLLLARPGRAILTLNIVAPVTSAAGTEILRLPVGASAVSRAVVTIGRQGVAVRVSGGMLLDKSENATGSRWVAHGRGNEPLSFSWKRKVEDQRAAQPLRFRGSITQLVGLGEDTTQVNAEIQIEVVQGLAKEIRVRLPEQFTANQVSGAMVADWEAAGRELVVTFTDAVQQSARFSVSGELRLPREGQIDVPLMRLSSAERETGGIGVEVLGAGEIKDRKAAGLDEAEAADLGQFVASRQSPSLTAYRLRPAEGKADRSLSLLVARYTPQAVLTANVEEARYNVLVTEDGKMLVQSRLSVRNNQRSFLKVTLPTSAALWSAWVAGRPIRPGKAPDGSLLIPLEKARSSEEAPAFTVEISYLDRVASWSEKGRGKLSLLTLDMPVSKSGLLVHYSPMFKFAALAGTFRSAPYEPPVSAVLQAASRPETNAADVSKLPEGSVGGAETQQLISRVKQSAGASRPIRNLPIRVAFPHFGPSIFLVSELTSETQTPVLEFDYQFDKKRGDK